MSWQTSIKQQMHESSARYDFFLLAPFLALISIGLLMVASASLAVSSKDFGSPFHFFLHQLIYVCIGLMLAYGASRVSLARWQQLSPIILLLAIVGLICVLMPGIGKSINGARRWIGLGFFHLQVSELAKFAMMIYLASYLSRRHREVCDTNWGFLKPLIVLASLGLLLLLEPDFGATAVIVVVTLGMMFLAGAPLKKFIILVCIAICMLALLVVFAPYRVERVMNFMNPWDNAYKGGYQLTQALMAFGRGELFGVGLGNSVQKLFYLPEAHTDFLYAVIGEELGLFGAVGLIALYAVLVGRMLYIGRQALNNQLSFNGYLSYGFALWLAFQTFVNIGVNIGLLPTKGLTLPFISYGGSSLLVSSIIFGIMLRLYMESMSPQLAISMPYGKQLKKKRGRV